jgi:hypothetical protein
LSSSQFRADVKILIGKTENPVSLLAYGKMLGQMEKASIGPAPQVPALRGAFAKYNDIHE